MSDPTDLAAVVSCRSTPASGSSRCSRATEKIVSASHAHYVGGDREYGAHGQGWPFLGRLSGGCAGAVRPPPDRSRVSRPDRPVRLVAVSGIVSTQSPPPTSPPPIPPRPLALPRLRRAGGDLAGRGDVAARPKNPWFPLRSTCPMSTERSSGSNTSPRNSPQFGDEVPPARRNAVDSAPPTR